MIVTRRELVRRMRADGIGAASEGLLDDTLRAIMAALVAPGDAVVLRGFGRFEVRVRKARAYRNPRTGVVTEVPATSFIHFKESEHVRGR